MAREGAARRPGTDGPRECQDISKEIHTQAYFCKGLLGMGRARCRRPAGRDRTPAGLHGCHCDCDQVCLEQSMRFWYHDLTENYRKKTQNFMDPDSPSRILNICGFQINGGAGSICGYNQTRTISDSLISF